MCGIAGVAGRPSKEILAHMIETIAHRGPDDRGMLVRGQYGLAHARLSILDTSPCGHQPMETPDKKLAVVLNGELYNFKALRADLEKRGVRFQSDTDTEVLLHLYREKGVECFKDLIGMFAIGICDFENDTLVLARDRMGEKPLYWTKKGDSLYFASEVKALITSGVVERALDMDALQHYLAFDYVPTPLSIWKGVHKLEPGTYLACTNGKSIKRTFWSPPSRISNVSESEAGRTLDDMLLTTVKRELISDVPLGVLLSGGIDSSAIAYYAQSASRETIQTFSVGFDDQSFDESSSARIVARHLKTNHHEQHVRAGDALALVSTLGEVLDEPLADPSLLPTLLLSRFARKKVTVALGGDGGDELFAGYPTFQAEELSRIPLLRAASGVVARYLPVSHENLPFSYALQKFASGSEQNQVHRHLEWLGTFDSTARRALVGASGNVFTIADAHASTYTAPDEYNRLLWTYARTYLMDQVLVKVDRASMHFALETRAPFLDHALVDFVFSLPYSMKYRRGVGKRLLKNVMRGKLPDSIIDRKKKGFGIPLARWLTEELKPLCTDLLGRDRLQQQGIFDPTIVGQLVDEHMNMKKDNRKELWNLMVFQLWYSRWMS